MRVLVLTITGSPDVLFNTGWSQAQQIVSSPDVRGCRPNDAERVAPFMPCDPCDHRLVASSVQIAERIVSGIDDDYPEGLYPDTHGFIKGKLLLP